MDLRFQSNPKEVKGMNTEELRANFLISSLMKEDEISLTYTHYDRVIVGGVIPVHQKVVLGNEEELKSDYIAVEGAILVESDGWKLFDEFWVVTLDKKIAFLRVK